MIKFPGLLVLLCLCFNISAQHLKPIIIERNTQKTSHKKGSLAAVGALIYVENFQDAGTTFPFKGITTTSADTLGFERGDTSQSNRGNGFVVPADPYNRFAYTNDDACNCDKSNDELILPAITFNGNNGAILQFSAYFNRSFPDESAVVYMENGPNWDKVLDIRSGPEWQRYEVVLKGAGIVNPKIKFVYSDSGTWASGLAIDSIAIYNPVGSADMRLDSILINEERPFEFYKSIPERQANALALNWRLRASNISSVTSNGVELITLIQGQNTFLGRTPVNNISALSDTSQYTLFKRSLAQGTGTYKFLNYVFSAGGDADIINDTTHNELEVTRSIYSRVPRNTAPRGFWYGPSVRYVIAGRFEITSRDTARHISVYLDPLTKSGDTMDVVIWNEGNTPVIPNAFPQINEDIVLGDDHIGKWYDYPIPPTELKPGIYFVGIRARGDQVIIGVNDRPVKNDLSRVNYGSFVGFGEYIPYVQLHLSGDTCPALNVSSSIIDAGCAKLNGQIVLNTSGGQAPYRYQWGASAGYSTQKAINGVGSGNYPVTITDTVGCSITSTFSISDSASFAVTLDSLNHEKCFGDSAGYIRLSSSGGVAPYTYQWTPNALGETRTKLTSGTYNVTISDASGGGCRVMRSIEVLGPREELSAQTRLGHNFCFADRNGIIDVHTRGGFGTYQYQWSDTSWNTPRRDSLRTRLYNVTITDANSCSYSDSARILGADSLGVSGTVFDTSGTADIYTTVIGGNPSYSYSWSGPPGFSDPKSANLLNLLDRGTYVVAVTDSLGCTAEREFEVAGSVGSVELDGDKPWVLYPNPSSEGFYLRRGNPVRSLQVVSVDGRIVYRANGVPQEKIVLNPGVYWIKLSLFSGTEQVLKALVVH